MRYDLTMRISISVFTLVVAIAGCTTPKPESKLAKTTASQVQDDPREVHLRNLKQLTRGVGENTKARWAFDSSELIMQSKRQPFSCDQVFRLPIDGSKPKRISTGLGQATSSHFLPGGREIVYSSTHQSSGECPAIPDLSQGEVWPIYREYNLFVANAKDGSKLRKLTNTRYYDAEATVCHDGSIVFSSTRNGDIDLYRMDRDGSHVVQLTDSLGYDGGAVFSKDCSQIVWQASRPLGKESLAYQRRLSRGMVKTDTLEIFVANADGHNVRQITYLDATSFAPSFSPDGKRVLFSTNVDKGQQEFDIWAVNVDGSYLERITYADGFDGFPTFSPDGKTLAFSSSRNQAQSGETDIFIADWGSEGHGEVRETGADVFVQDLQWLADDARGGRGIGSEGIEASADWIAKRFAELGLAPGVEASFFQPLQVVTSIEQGKKSALKISRTRAVAGEFVVAGFSKAGSVSGKAVFVEYGLVSEELGLDDYKGCNLKGKIAVIRRFTPDTELFKHKKKYRLHSSLHRKAFLARERGAVGVVVVNQAPSGNPDDEEAPLPNVALERLRGVGIPVVIASRDFARGLRTTLKSPAVAITVDFAVVKTPSRNVVGRLVSTSAAKGQAPLVIGAHYDHLGMGGAHSLDRGKPVIHNGADDNASGVAALLDVAKTLAKHPETLGRDVLFVAFTGEENGLLGSQYFVENSPETIGVGERFFAMLNMDMVGRLRSNQLRVLGADSAAQWKGIANASCQKYRVHCYVGGDGYGPSDQTSFTNGGYPVLYFTTGAHSDYHKSTDDAEFINAMGGKQIADLVADIALQTAGLKGINFQKTVATSHNGDRRSFGASLGTIPNYADDSKEPGMLLSGVRPGGAADLAGLRAGDRLLAVDDTEVHSVQDLVYVLQTARPGQEAVARVLRGKHILMLKIVFQKSSKR